MEQILDDFLEARQSDYRAKVKIFDNGKIEGVLRAVKPMTSDALHAAAVYPLAYRPLRVGLSRTDEELQEARQENAIRASRRAKTMVRHGCMAMSADRLLTLTVRENVEDIDQFYRVWKRFLRLVRDTYPEFAYIAVPERQERGAWHMHVAIQGWVRISTLRNCWYRALGGTGQEAGDQTPGQVDIRGPKGRQRLYRTWKTTNLAAYISKYMAKTFDASHAGERRYFRSANLPEIPKTRVFWVAGSNITEALKQFIFGLQFEHQLRPAWDMWLSDQGDVFWINGVIAT